MPAMPRISTINPEALFTGGGSAPMVRGNPMSEAMDAVNQQQATQQQQQFENQQKQEATTLKRDRLNLQQTQHQDQQQQQQMQMRNTAMLRMLENPMAADIIAQQVGIPITPEMRTLFADREKSQLVKEALVNADKMQVKNPKAIMQYLQSYVQNRGQVEPANQSIQGMTLHNPHDTSRQAQPRFLRDGMMMLPGTAEAVPIPGMPPQDPTKNPRVPYAARQRLESLSRLNPTDTYAHSEDGRVTVQNEFDRQLQEVEPFLDMPLPQPATRLAGGGERFAKDRQDRYLGQDASGRHLFMRPNGSKYAYREE